MTIEAATERFILLNKNLRKLGMGALMETREDYLNAQREQMLVGEDRNGEKIGDYRSKIYGEMKLVMNPRAGGNVDLKLKGGFHEGLILRPKNERIFEEYSLDWKNDMLSEKYGVSIFLLNPKHLEPYRQQFFLPALRRWIREAIFYG